MIVLFYGTSAELIKMYGIMQSIPRSEAILICSAQHNKGLEKVHEQLGIYPDIFLSNGWFGEDVKSIPQMAVMMTKAHIKYLSSLRVLKKNIRNHDKMNDTNSIAVVHGDTLTTLVGSYLSKFLGLPLAHVEAGLRTHNWRSPFPEEIDRKVASKLSVIHYAPSQEAHKNLLDENVKGEIIDTKFNTAKDAIEQSAKFLSDNFKNLNLPKNYCLVLLHRTELLENKNEFEKILKVLNKYGSSKTPVVFTEHSTTSKKIEKYNFNKYLEKDGITVIPKQAYFDFMEVVRNAELIVTDGGGLQEDAYFLGIPTIIHRKVTERPDGIGINAELSGFDAKNVEKFLATHKSKKDLQKNTKNVSPSKIVVDHLRKIKAIKK